MLNLCRREAAEWRMNMIEREPEISETQQFIDGYKQLHKLDSLRYIVTILCFTVIIALLISFIFFAYFTPLSSKEKELAPVQSSQSASVSK